MPATPRPETVRRAPRWMLVAAVRLAGAQSRRRSARLPARSGAPARRRRGPAPSSPTCWAMPARLPPERRKELWEQTAEEREHVRPFRREVRAAREETVKALVAEPFERAALPRRPGAAGRGREPRPRRGAGALRQDRRQPDARGAARVPALARASARPPAAISWTSPISRPASRPRGEGARLSLGPGTRCAATQPPSAPVVQASVAPCISSSRRARMTRRLRASDASRSVPSLVAGTEAMGPMPSWSALRSTLISRLRRPPWRWPVTPTVPPAGTCSSASRRRCSSACTVGRRSQVMSQVVQVVSPRRGAVVPRCGGRLAPGLAHQRRGDLPLALGAGPVGHQRRHRLGDGQGLLGRLQQPSAALGDVVGVFLVAGVARAARATRAASPPRSR